MNITLYKCTAENNRLDKTDYLTVMANYPDCTSRSSLSLMAPQILIEEDISVLSQCNYLYIAEFGRYYYIDSITAGAMGVYVLQCTIDVLMSFKADILQMQGVVERQEQRYDMYLSDGEIPIGARKNFSVYRFPGSMNRSTHTLSMLVVGGE